MLVSSGAIVVLTAAADPWIWMVMATSLVAVVWLAVTHLGAQLAAGNPVAEPAIAAGRLDRPSGP